MNSPSRAFFAGLKSVVPMLIGAIPFGVIYGVVAIGAGVPFVLAQAISLIIFAGSAQFIAAHSSAPALPAP